MCLQRGSSKWIIVSLIFLLAINVQAFASELSDALGLYFADSEGKCRSQEVVGIKVEDFLLSRVRTH